MPPLPQLADSDPAVTFGDPFEVMRHAELSVAEQREILRNWLYDASAMAVAEQEGMLGPDDDLVRRILLALEQLPDSATPGPSPTKHHGIAQP